MDTGTPFLVVPLLGKDENGVRNLFYICAEARAKSDETVSTEKLPETCSKSMPLLAQEPIC